MRLRRRLIAAVTVTAASLATLAGGALTASPAGAAGSTPPPIQPTAFGVHYMGVGETSGRYWPAVKYGILRIWDNGTSWRELEPARGQWDPTALARLDYLMLNASRLHKQVLLTLGQTPQWASTCPDRTSDPSLPGDPRVTFFYGPGAGCEPADYGDWNAYVSFLLNRYGSRISAIEPWNEANYPTYWQSSGGMNSSTAYTAMAQIALHTQQVVAGFNAAHGTRIGVISPSFGARHPNMPGWVQNFLVQIRAIGGMPTAIAIHGYPNTGANPESILTPLAKVKAIRDKYAPGRPIWDNEIGFGLMSAHYLYGVGGNAQGIVARAFLVELSSGVSKMFWYGWGDRTYSGLYVTNADGTTSNNGLALNRVYGWLVGTRPYGCGHGNTVATQYIWTCRLLLPGGVHAHAVWAVKGTPTITMPSGTQRIDFASGGGYPVVGGYRLRIGTVPVLIRGSFAL
jgi:hypothetical protein